MGAPLIESTRPARAAAGDRLVVAVGQWGTETPFAWRTVQAEKPLWDCIYDPLIQRDPKTFEYRPGLATEWKPSNELKTWTFKLRSGVKFHEGWGDLTSEDVKFTVEQNLMAILETMGLNAETRRTRLRELLAELNLTPLARAPAYTLSGGERRRAEITRALVMAPKFILLDEPFAGIDPIAVTDIQKIIFHLKERGIGVLITDHNVRETLDIVDRACIIYDGQVLFAGTPEALVADQEVRRLYLGESFAL